MLVTDYLVIGAGAASMAFVDTLLTESPDVSVLVVDRHAHPGGHWNDGYGFVQLHQPSLLYGVASQQLEGSWFKLLAFKGMLPWKHRATKTEILDYYQRIMNKWVASGRVQYFPESLYNFDKESDSGSSIHKFTNEKTNKMYQVRVREKLVNGILGECRVPSKTPPTFPVQENIPILTPNDVYDFQKNESSLRLFSSPSQQQIPRKYVVLGAGKTAMDTVVFLQNNLKVLPENITWIVANDVWMLRRDGSGSPWSWGQALLENNFDGEKAALDLEEKGIFTRLDKHTMPTKFRFPVVGDDELRYMQNLTKVIRRGRVTSISLADDNNDRISIQFDAGKPLLVDTDQVFVHCTSPGPFTGQPGSSPFVSSSLINLEFLYAPPVPISMSCIAALESQRRHGKIDVELGRYVVGKKDATANEVLSHLISGYNLRNHSDVSSKHGMAHIQPLVTLAAFICLFDSDPSIGYNWMKKNRLSFFSIPGFNGRVCENVCKILEKEKVLNQLEDEDITILRGLAEKLKPLEAR